MSYRQVGSLLMPAEDATQRTVSKVRSRTLNAYMQGGGTPVFQGWQPFDRDLRDDIRLAWRAAAARMTDMVQNSGWIAGMIDQAVANTVGTGLRLVSMPDADVLGMTLSEANAWARRVERRFELWAEKPYEFDLEGRMNAGKFQAAALRSWLATGEICADVPWRERFGAEFRTKARLIPPTRMSDATDDSRNQYHGVRMNSDGLPIAYTFKRRRKFMDQDQEIMARDPEGRVQVIHIFDGVAGQIRGITPFVPVLKVARRFDQLSDATLTAALIQTVFAATIKSDVPTPETMQGLMTPQEQASLLSTGGSTFDAWFDAQQGWYESANIDVGLPGRIGHLFPGQDLTFHSSQHPNTAYEAFSSHLLREMARCCGLTFEDATGDYRGATYSSVRMATAGIYQITLYRRKNLIAPLMQPLYESWLEEDIDSGKTPFPGGIEGFILNRTAASRAAWKGSPKPQADDLKTANAHKIYDDMGVITDEMICNDLGVDVEDVYEQRVREQEMRDERGLVKASPSAPAPQPAPADENA